MNRGQYRNVISTLSLDTEMLFSPRHRFSFHRAPPPSCDDMKKDARKRLTAVQVMVDLRTVIAVHRCRGQDKNSDCYEHSYNDIQINFPPFALRGSILRSRP